MTIRTSQDVCVRCPSDFSRPCQLDDEREWKSALTLLNRDQGAAMANLNDLDPLQKDFLRLEKLRGLEWRHVAVAVGPLWARRSTRGEQLQLVEPKYGLDTLLSAGQKQRTLRLGWSMIRLVSGSHIGDPLTVETECQEVSPELAVAEVRKQTSLSRIQVLRERVEVASTGQVQPQKLRPVGISGSP